MNDKTAVAVFGYAGDCHQIQHTMPYYAHHHCPVIVLSPEDSAITKDNLKTRTEVTFRTGGVKAYTGEASLLRQKRHLEILLEYPYEYFLMNDSDSVCLSPELPGYLYADDPAIVWSNVVSDEMHPREEGYPFPRLAFQPPYFIHRASIQKLVEAAPTVEVNPRTPFIDWCMMSWCVKAGLPYRGFPDGVSCPTANYEPGFAHMQDRIRNQGAIFLHSIKQRDVLLRMAHARVAFKRTHARDTKLFR